MPAAEQLFAKLIEPAVIGKGGADQTDAVTGVGMAVNLRDDLLQRPAAEGMIDMAGSAKAAAPAAAAADLDHEHLEVGVGRDTDRTGRGMLFNINEAPPHPARLRLQAVHGGHPRPLDMRQSFQQLLPPLPLIQMLLIGPGELGDHLLSLADEKKVGGRGHDVRIIKNSHPTHQDEGIPAGALPGQQGDARPFEHLQDQRIVHLVSEGKSDDPELVQGLLGFKGMIKGSERAFQLEGPFAFEEWLLVQQPVDGLISQTRHTRCVTIGIDERQWSGAGGRELAAAAFCAEQLPGVAPEGPVLISHGSRPVSWRAYSTARLLHHRSFQRLRRHAGISNSVSS